MQKRLTVAAIAVSILFLIALGLHEAWAFNPLGEIWEAATGFETTLTVLKVEVQPSISTDSYFLVYGTNMLGEMNIVELQINDLSVWGNLHEGFAGELNRDAFKYIVESNVGNNITFECNGFQSFSFMEEYPQCYRIVDIVGESHPPVSSIAELDMWKASQIALGQ